MDKLYLAPVPDGKYIVKLLNGTPYQMTRIKEVWYFSSGDDCIEKVHAGQEFISLTPIDPNRKKIQLHMFTPGPNGELIDEGPVGVYRRRHKRHIARCAKLYQSTLPKVRLGGSGRQTRILEAIERALP